MRGGWQAQSTEDGEAIYGYVKSTNDVEEGFHDENGYHEVFTTRLARGRQGPRPRAKRVEKTEGESMRGYFEKARQEAEEEEAKMKVFDHTRIENLS